MRKNFGSFKFPPPGNSCRSQCKSSWNEEASTAFEDIKVALSNATLLNYPQHDSPTALFVDASDKLCGAVLSQIDSSGSHRPSEYFSAAFSDAQKRYSTFDKELLAAYLAVHHFTYFLEGRPFTLYTDHKPLVGAISRKKTPLSNRRALSIDDFIKTM